MKKSLLILLFVSLFFSIFGNTKNEVDADAKSVIAGRIVDSDNLPLPGASIIIESINAGAVSDVNGYYRITSLDEGEYNVTVSYIGFKQISKTVTVKKGKTVELNFELEAGIDIEEVVVNGSLQGQSKALNQQKNSLNITNIISSDQVTRFPDANIGDALKRVPGINVQYDQGEARFGNIRGTAPEYNSVTINGDRIPSAEAEIRAIQLDLIPSDMVQAIEVNKVVTPDMEADAIGGSVNLITKNSPYKQRISGTIGGGYNFLSDKTDKNLSLVYADRFFNEKLGMILSGSYQNIQLGSDNIEGEWDQEDNLTFMTDFQIRAYQVQRERQSYSASFDYKIDPNNIIEFKGIYNHRKDWENRFRFRFNGIEKDGDDWIVEMRRENKFGTSDQKNARLEDQHAMNFALNGTHFFGSVKFDWKGSYAKASEDRPNERYITYRMKKVKINPDLSDPRKPFFNILTESAKDLNEEWSFKEMTDQHQYTGDIDKNFKTNIEFPWLKGDFKNKIKFGFSYKGKSKERANKYFKEYEPVDEDAFNAGIFANLVDKSKDNFLAGEKYQVGKFIDREYLGKIDLNSSDFEGSDVIEELAGNFEATENVTAGYFRLDQSLGKKIDIIAGFRIENTNLEYSGRVLEINEDGDPTLNTTSTETDNYTNFLPSLIGKLSLSDNTKIKAAWTNTIARPRYFDLVPHVEINLEDMEASVGNPGLEPTKSMNFDIMFEHYFTTIGQISAGAFYKNITDFIVTQELRDHEFNGRTYDKFYKPYNAGDADLMGFEFSFQRQFDFLPGFLKQTGFYANYTYNYSKVKNFNLEGREDEDMPLPGTPTNTLNASVYYEGKKLTLRASFNYADDFIDEVGDDAFYDRYYDKVTYLDLNANYLLTPDINIFLEANNLLNQPLRYYQGISERLMQEEFYNVKIFFGVKFDF
ncbi:MAG: TonB-dependent receptor [Prolixibacteraceae bacterium]|nr:TonB-dependent receptor [Prolixibacteraceae bacterium]MBN2775432.1 TonB-dependent receptor [Prolixibacteraceae bacterium]